MSGMKPAESVNETEYTRYFVAKCGSVDALLRCVNSGKWACRERVNPPQPHEVLTSAFSQGRVVLLFSVNNCHGWHGYCSMASLPTSAKEGSDYEVRTKQNAQGAVSESEWQNERSGIAGGDDIAELEVENQVKDAGKNNTQISVGKECGRTDSSVGHEPEAVIPKPTPAVGDKNSEFPSGQSVASSTSEPPGVWHHFQVNWHTQFITDFGETCLASSHTQSFLLPDGTPFNKARNWQEVSLEVGGRVCQLLDGYLASLVKKRKTQEEEKQAARPPPFLRSEVDVDVPDDPETYWRYVVQKVERELGRVHLACPFGSQRYNLQQPGSDIDAFIIYQAHTKDLLGFNPPKLTLKNSEREACDYTVLELQRYCELLLAGDPRCVETLFLHDSTIIQASKDWQKLQEIRQLVLTRKCLDKYLSDALGSNGVKRLQRWQQENRDVNGDDPPPDRLSKLMYIVVRLLQNALDIVKGRPLCVFRPEGSHDQQTLLRLRRAEISLNEIKNLVQGLQNEIEEGKARVPADNHDLKNQLENWLLSLRFCDFQTHPPQLTSS